MFDFSVDLRILKRPGLDDQEGRVKVTLDAAYVGGPQGGGPAGGNSTIPAAYRDVQVKLFSSTDHLLSGDDQLL